MNNVVRFENTQRKLDWKQEESLRDGKKQDRQRRDSKIHGRVAKTIGEEE